MEESVRQLIELLREISPDMLEWHITKGWYYMLNFLVETAALTFLLVIATKCWRTVAASIKEDDTPVIVIGSVIGGIASSIGAFAFFISSIQLFQQALFWLVSPEAFAIREIMKLAN